MGAPTSFVFEQQGQFWVLQDKTAVCGAGNHHHRPRRRADPRRAVLPGCAAGWARSRPSHPGLTR